MGVFRSNNIELRNNRFINKESGYLRAMLKRWVLQANLSYRKYRNVY